MLSLDTEKGFDTIHIYDTDRQFFVDGEGIFSELEEINTGVLILSPTTYLQQIFNNLKKH